MRVVLDSTEKLVTLNGLPARVWEGQTEGGVQVHCYITRVAVREGQDPKVYEVFERELMEVRPASPEVAEIPTRLVL